MDIFDGQVLPGARASTSNASTTGEVSSGVSRAVFTSNPAQYPSASITDIQGARYRTTLLGSNQTVEYLLWADSSGPLVVAPGTESTKGTISIPTGTLTVNDATVPLTGVRTDGTNRVILTDDGGANIASLITMKFVRGGTIIEVTFTAPDFTFDPASGTITLNDTANVRAAVNVPALDPVAISSSRGDKFTSVTYTLSGARFNWTRNDPTGTRFGWNAAHRKWEPYKGGATKNLGRLASSGRFTLTPVPLTQVGNYLPGTATTGQYAMLRLGGSPDETAYPVVLRTPGPPFSGVLVVTDDLANSTYNFGSTNPPLAGVIGKNSGTIAWNPAFISAHEGETLWYSPRNFETMAKGEVGSVLDTLFIAPVPAPVERPILRIGVRAPLIYLPVENEATLGALTVNPGEVGVALSTGKVKLNAADQAQANPASGSFDPLFLDAMLRYDGVALNRYPQPVQAVSLLTLVGSDLYIPLATGLPGTGFSGLVRVPDGTGNTPDPSLPVYPRPVTSGLVERLTPGFGDAFLLTRLGRVAKLVPVNFDNDLPTDIYSMPLDTAYVSLDTGKVAMGASLATELSGQDVYFAQGVLTPSLYPDGPRIFSRIRDTFTLTGTENFSFRVDGVNHTYVPTISGVCTADQVAANITTVTGVSTGVVGGYLYIASALSNGTVSVGFNEEGCRVLGFPPGWYVSNPTAGTHDATDLNWLPDSGVAFGLSRSPNNLDGSQDAPDVRSTYRVEDTVLMDNVQGVPYQLLNYPPREDIAGYDTGLFFALSGMSTPGSPTTPTALKPYVDVLYQFGQSRFAWVSKFSFGGQVQSPVSSINLGAPGVIPSTFYGAMGGSFKVSRKGESAQSLTLDTDFLVPAGSGTAILIDRIGPLKQSGYRGSVTGSTLTDTSTTISASPGDRLKVVSTQSQGSYLVTGSTSSTIVVSPAFPTVSTSNVSWELYQGVAPGVIDPSVAADAVYEDFNHLPSEPYEVRILTPLGTAGNPLNQVPIPVANSGHDLRARFGITPANTVPPSISATILTSTVLGGIANSALHVPTAGARFTTGAFSILVGTRLFSNGVDLLPVANFLAPCPAGVVQYLTTTGELRFGSTVLSDYASATVVYRQEVLASASILAGTVEISPFTGDIGLSSTDITAHLGETVYLVDLQTFEDVYLNPILGSFTFKRPIETGQLVEATYFRAVPDSGTLYTVKGQPVQVVELLPVYIRREAANRINANLYSFNPLGRTVDTGVTPSVYVGPKLVSYGVPSGVTFTFSDNTFSLMSPVQVTVPPVNVLVSYAVYEAVGGETTYTVSQGPVWRPPFKLTANSKTFLLDTDRTTDMVPGKILRIGNYLTYVQASLFNVTTGITTVRVFPVPDKNVGSMAPSDPPINLLTDRAITPTVDPQGAAVPTGADGSFLPRLTDAYGLAAIPEFQKVTKGQPTIRFNGDLTQYAVTGHVLELFGSPYLISKCELVDGKYTDITFGSPSPVELVWASGMNPDYIRISVRPVYPVNSTVLIGAGGFVSTEPYEVVLFERTNPGVTLTEGKDYQLDQGAGTLTLLTPRTSGLPAQSSLRFYRTVQETLAPFVYQGIVQYPRVSASAGFIDPPSSTNGRLGAVLQATYTFESPDSFYARSLPLPSYISETSVGIVKGVSSAASGNNPSAGGSVTPSASANGVAGLTSERQDLVSRDRVTRTFLRWYNGIITSFEQVLENITGNPVGDRNGKLRLWMGTDDLWTPPGYEDGITGEINNRNVWSEVWNGYRSTPIALILTDPIIDPTTATLDSNGNPVGTALSSSALDRLMERQQSAIKNDVDDLVLVGLRDTTLSLAGIIRFQVTSYGTYRGLSEPSAFSRLFPERVDAFTTTDPGLGYDPGTGASGVYSYGKLLLDPFGDPPSVAIQSTSGRAIARLANPTRGNITSVLGATVSDRKARARLISYSPSGYTGVTTRPAFIATVLPLDQFPKNSDGTPDTARFISVSLSTTDLPDLTTGDPSLHTPPFKAGDQVSLGTPDGAIYGLGYSDTTVTVGGQNVYAGVFVDSIIQGCYLTLKTYHPAGTWIPITNANFLVRLVTTASGDTLTASMVEQGDTLFVIPTTGAALTGIADPPTTTQLAAYAQSLPTYRTGTDVGLNGRTGELVDITLPSFGDPNIFGLKEILGQKPPPPMQTLQAGVTFQNGDTSPSNIPALRGLARMDSGDYSLPYYGVTPTELSVLGDLFPDGIAIVTTDTVNPADNPPALGYPVYTIEAAYPDEILDNAGSVSSSPGSPATLVTSVAMNPTYTTNSGVGPLDPYDLVFVQEDTGGLPGGLPGGSTGILTAGDVTNGVTPGPSWIEPPRFVSRSNTVAGRTILNVTNIQVFIEADPPHLVHTKGMKVSEFLALGVYTTTFTLVGILTSSIVFDDGSGGGSLPTPVGGFNDFFTQSDVGTSFKLKLMDKTTGAFVLGADVVFKLATWNPSILLCKFQVSGDGGSTYIPGTHNLSFAPQKLTVTTNAPFFDFPAFGVVYTPPSTQMGPLDFAIDIDAPSTHAYAIQADRLTVAGPVDTRSAHARGLLNPALEPIECQLTTLGGDTYIERPTLPATQLLTTINHVSMVNGGLPFTFLPRTFSPYGTYGVGVFTGGVGTLKVMAFEGYGNTPISGTGITFSAAPSARQDTSGAILTAITYSDRWSNPGVTHTVKWGDNRFIVDLDPMSVPPSLLKGSMDRVLPGDIVVVKSTNEDPAAATVILNGKAGTHLVRGVVAPDTLTKEKKAATYVTPDALGEFNGWMPFEFPTVVHPDPSTLEVTNIEALPPTTSWVGVVTVQTHVFPPTGRVYVIVDETGLNSTTGSVFAASIVSAAYTTLNTVNQKFQGLSDYRDGLNVPISGATFVARAAVGKKVSGMTILPVNPHGPGIPENLPGFCNGDPGLGPSCLFGFRTVVVSRLGSTTYNALTSGVAGWLTPVGPAVSKLYVHEKIKVTSDTFLTLDIPVYDEIPGVITTDLVSDWDIVHNPAAPGPAPFILDGARCLLPGDTWTVSYEAAAGIFVEPSFPRQENDLGGASVNVVDANNSLTPTTVGMRRLPEYLVTGPTPGQDFIERAEVEVRRPRRFHDIGNAFAGSLLSLRYAYEIRRGITGSVMPSSGYYSTLTAQPVSGAVPPVAIAGGTATQLGDFTTKLVNVNPGDEVRFLDANGVIFARAEVVTVTGALTLLLSRKVTVNFGDRFEIYLKVPPVPHEQSNEELLGYATDTVLVSRSANMVTHTGGLAPSVNVLADTDGRNYGALGVRAGDIVLVDPAGALTTPVGPANPVQYGRRPYGDDAVLGRTGYVAGGPARADDNRGYYQVAVQPGTTISVQPMGDLAGTPDVIFGTAGNEYAIYPTIHASGLTSGVEGQMDLRPTAPPVGTSYTTNWNSVEPFSYRVIRPTGLLSSSAVELILAMRERMLSWAEEIRFVGWKYGTYFIFQRDAHIRDLGLTSDPESGLGLLTNAYIVGLVGHWDLAPYTNVRDCLAILDRRFWVLDMRLDDLTPPYGPFIPYADFAGGVGRPVEVDRVNETLDGRDKLRITRYSWLTLRVDRVKGTLEGIRRFDTELPKRQADAEQALVAVQSVEKV
jgi:hypothetical protein